VWLRGAVHREYLGVGGARGRLGLPVSDAVKRTRVYAADGCSSCRRLVLEGGRIYFKAGLGAHALWGQVLSAYLSNGGAGGRLGYPRTRVRASGGVQRASFEHGTIACSGGSCDVQFA
jgi:uncharacterized protein with LGFP repeats